MSSLDVILPVYNNLDITSRCLSALELFAPSDARIILVDNGSADDIPSLKPRLEALGNVYIRLDPNKGPYGAVNAGLAVATAPLIGIVCNDVVVLPGTLQAMIAAIHPTRPCVGAVGLVLPKFDLYECQAHAALRGWNMPRLIPGVCFSCCVMMREVIDTVGTFDERFGLTFGDTDWEQRYADKGLPYYLVLNAPIYHGHGVGRKRGGIEADISNDLRDYDAFVEKYKDRPDVLAKHPRETPEQKRAALEQFWQDGEQ